MAIKHEKLATSFLVAEAKTWYLHPIESAPACGSNRIVWLLMSFVHTTRQEFPAGDRWGSHHKLNACFVDIDFGSSTEASRRSNEYHLKESTPQRYRLRKNGRNT
jgi:hypothetical protein